MAFVGCTKQGELAPARTELRRPWEKSVGFATSHYHGKMLLALAHAYL